MDGDDGSFSPDTGAQILDAQGPAQAEALYGGRAAAVADGSANLSDMATITEAKDWGPMLFQSPLSSIPGA